MLNDWFSRNYAQRVGTVEQRVRDGTLPVLIRLGDDAILLRGHRREVVRVLSDRYHALKSVCHAPIAIYLPLAPRCDQDLTQADLEPLAGLRTALDAFAADQAPMRALRDASVAFVDGVSRARRVDRNGLAAYERQTREPIRACIDLAAREELETLHGCVRSFTSDFTDADWRAFRVIICASHQPRYRQSAKQYFKRLLLENHGIEDQVLYGENCRTEEEALKLLAVHLLDRELAEFFLGSPLDLQQDVLGDAAARVVKELFPEPA